MIGPGGATGLAPGVGADQAVAGYVNAVLRDLERNLKAIPELQDQIGPSWDPLPTCRFHLLGALTRLAKHNLPRPTNPKESTNDGH